MSRRPIRVRVQYKLRTGNVPVRCMCGARVGRHTSHSCSRLI